jgi:hypothetical protein
MPEQVGVGAIQPERFYRLEGEERYDRLISECKVAIEVNRQRRSEALEFASLFEGIRLSSFGNRGYGCGDYKIFKDLDIPIVRNTCRAIVRTGYAKITSLDDPLPQFMTTGGDWAQRIKNVKLDHMVECEMDQPQGVFDSTSEAWRHAALLAMSCSGSCGVFSLAVPNAMGVRVEVDDTLTMRVEYSGRYGKAISLVRTAYYAAADLAEMWPEYEDAIYANEAPDDEDGQGTAHLDDNETIPGRSVAVCQGWLASTKSTMGCMVWVLRDGTVLCDDDYEPKELPVAFWHYERSLFGHWGTPLTRTIYHQCMRINEIINDVDNAERNSPQGFVFYTPEMNANGQLSKAKAWNRIEVEDMNSLPQAIPAPKYASQSVDLLNFHEQGAYSASGVSEANVAAKRSIGSTSGEHEHLIASLFTERFADQERTLTRARAIHTGRLFVYALKQLAEADPDYKRLWRPKDSSIDPEEIQIKDLDLDAEKYITTIAAVSEKKDSPKDRADKAYEQLQMGVIDPPTYFNLLRHFDDTAVDEVVSAQEDWVDQQIGRWLHASDEQIRERDFYQSPAKWMTPLEGLQTRVSAQWLKARTQGAPRERLAFFERFLSELQAYIDRRNLQMTPPQATPQMMGAPALGPGAPVATMQQMPV